MQEESRMKTSMDTTRTDWHLISRGWLPGALLVAVVTSACASSSPQPARSPLDQAAFMERTRCSTDDDEKALAPVLSGTAVQAVRPLYGSASSGKSGNQSDLRGAIMTVAALAGVTDVWLDRALECHSAKEMLGHIPASSDDPFWLPGSTVDIDVRSAKDGFDLAVTGYSTDDATQIFARAEAFAKSRNPAAPKAAEVPR
jgi:hypothetical protein